MDDTYDELTAIDANEPLSRLLRHRFVTSGLSIAHTLARGALMHPGSF